MKTILIIIFFLPLTALSQVNCENCKQKEYPFIGCKNGVKTTLCLSDPNNIEGFLPWKKCLNNVTITYDPTNYPLKAKDGTYYGITFPRNDGFRYEKVFSRHQIEQRITEAFNDWLQPSCFPNVNNDRCQPCNLRVTWAGTTDEMGYYPRATAITVQNPQKPITGGECTQDCTSTEIRLNGTPDWTGINPNDVKGSIEGGSWNQFFRTDFLEEVTTGKLYDLRSVMRHEIGHWLGFGDMVGTRIQSCSNNNSIMDADNFSYDKNVDITTDDRCMFTVLYCCPTNPISVQEPATINSTFNIYPNPTFSDVTISLSASAAQYPKRLRVVDINGKTVLEQAFTAGSSDCVVKTNGLSKGTYLFVISFDGINGSYAEKVIIQ